MDPNLATGETMSEGGVMPPEAPENEAPETPATEKAEDGGKSALLPKSLFGGSVTPGQTITMKVSAVYGDEVEVSMSDDAETPEPSGMSADDEIDMMDGGK